MTPLGIVHTGFAVLALGAGAGVVLRAKGTPGHRVWGRVYLGAMLGLNGTAFGLTRLFGGFGPFHAAAAVSLLTLLMGVAAVLLRRPREGWMEAHAYWMCWSYVGLWAAAASEAAVRLPGTPFWGGVALATAAVCGVGAVLVHRRVPATLAPTPESGRNPDHPRHATDGRIPIEEAT